MSFLNTNWNLIIFFILTWSIAFTLLYFRARHIKEHIEIKLWPLLLKSLLRSSILASLLIALAGPHISDRKGNIEVTSTSRDFLVALDLSHSMLANDLKPNRLDRAKLFLTQLSTKMKGDNFGLVIFSSNAFIQCPLTYDVEYFNKMLNFAHPRLVPTKGTDLYPPLSIALERLTHRNQVDSKSKIIILLSDGEDFGEEMDDIAEKIKSEGIKVYCIGIGTTAGGNNKPPKGLKRDFSGNVVKTSLNKASLEKLAEITDGEYFEISNDKYELDELLLSLDAVKGQKNMTQKKKAPKTTFYHYFLFLALLLLIFDFIVRPKLLNF